MGTGVIEGAYGHLVNDRMEQSGMRGAKAGAQVGLDWRAVRLHGHWEAYGPLHRPQPHHRLYGGSAPMPDSMESPALQFAA